MPRSTQSPLPKPITSHPAYTRPHLADATPSVESDASVLSGQTEFLDLTLSSGPEALLLIAEPSDHEISGSNEISF